MSDISVTDLLDNLREGFLDDLPTRINVIESEVMASQDTDTYDELFRMVHSLKGSAGSYSFQVITKITHDMEDVMFALAQRNMFRTPSTLKILLSFVDILRDAVDLLIESKSPPLDVDERLEALADEVFSETISILVSEPSNLYASLIEFSLANLPIKFTFVQGGLQAMEKLLLNKYDLLITSLENPQLNGDALTAALRLVHNNNKDIEVILITSQSRDKIVNKDDFDAILERKSVKDGGLLKIVKKLINSK